MTNVIVKQDDGDTEVSLADIAGIDMTSVEAFEGGFEPTPKGVYLFDVKDAGLDTITVDGVDKAVIYFETEIAECYALVDDSIEPESMVGWKHRETVFISDLKKSVGQAKAIMQNAGFSGSGTLEEMLDAFCGSQFVAPIKHRKDKNDTDKIYSNIVVSKITPPPEATVQEVADGHAVEEIAVEPVGPKQPITPTKLVG